MDFFYSILGFFASGGAFMFPILLVFAVGTAVAVERFITLAVVTNKNQAVWEKVQPLLAEGKRARFGIVGTPARPVQVQVKRGGVALPQHEGAAQFGGFRQ